jgi:deoxyribodipyrimidine photo-lyase
VRRWVPELRDVPTAVVHAPWLSAEPPDGYPPPVVDHGEARARALEALSAAARPSRSAPQSAARRASQPASPRRTS